MEILTFMADMGHENVFYCNDGETGLKAIIAIHDTTLGPALGGCRMLPYENEEEAFIDVLRLSRGMTFKNAVAGLDLGGGKSVIIGDPVKEKSSELLQCFAEFVDRLQGLYITAEDMGTTVADMDIIYTKTKWVTGKSSQCGGSGDPSPITALGTYWGMKAAAKHALNDDCLRGKRIAIHGVGNVGIELAKLLYEEGAELLVADINTEALQIARERFGAKVVDSHDMYGMELDILAPCARGGVINDETLKILKAKVIAGAANNILSDPAKHGQALMEKKIIYAPDYVINAGGVVHVYYEWCGKPIEASKKRAREIYHTVDKIIRISEEENIPTNRASQYIAEERIRMKR